MKERLCLLYGKENVEYLSSMTVCIVGVGGVGGMALEALARTSIGTLILVDFDTVAPSNINRQLVALNSTIGKAKVACFEERIHAINPDCHVITIQEKLTEENIDILLNEPISFLLDACDDSRAKVALAKWCQKMKIPSIMALGAGNRKEVELVEITTLKKTSEDALARKMRTLFRKEGLSLDIPVVYSREKPIENTTNTIASSIFTPATAGLYAANYIVKTLLDQKEKNLSK